jgi:hypothetical protein
VLNYQGFLGWQSLAMGGNRWQSPLFIRVFNYHPLPLFCLFEWQGVAMGGNGARAAVLGCLSAFAVKWSQH